MYEIWSMSHRPFEDDDGREVKIEHIIISYAMYIHT